MVSLGAWHALSLHAATPDTIDAAGIGVLAAQEPAVDYAMALIGEYLGSALRSLREVTADVDVWEDARGMIAGMLADGVHRRHHTQIAQGVAAWPA